MNTQEIMRFHKFYFKKQISNNYMQSLNNHLWAASGTSICCSHKEIHTICVEKPDRAFLSIKNLSTILEIPLKKPTNFYIFSKRYSDRILKITKHMWPLSWVSRAFRFILFYFLSFSAYYNAENSIQCSQWECIQAVTWWNPFY